MNEKLIVNSHSLTAYLNNNNMEESSSTTFENMTSETDYTQKELTTIIISAIASNLNEIIAENSQNFPSVYIRRDIFYMPQIPMISLEDYLSHIMKFSKMELPTLILAIIYLDKMCEFRKYILSYQNIHRLLLAACLLSVKFNEDISFNNRIFAKIGGVSVEVLNILEFEFYVLLNFSLFVDDLYYQEYYMYFTKCLKHRKKEYTSNKVNSGYSQDDFHVNYKCY